MTISRVIDEQPRVREHSREFRMYSDHWDKKWPAITIHQPWASLIMGQYKLVENRIWRTRYRGPLIIHAGLNKKLLGDSAAYRLDGYDLPDPLPLGAVLGVVLLEDCTLIDNLPPRWSGDPFATGPYGWCLSGVTPLPEPLKYTGKQTLFSTDDNVQRVVRSAVKNYFGVA